MKYSIWVIPPEPAFSILQRTINELAEKYGGPVFEPHMTILGNVSGELPEIEKKLKELASHIDKLELGLGPVSFSTTYFQSVLARVNSNAKLMQLNLDVKKIFGMENDVFMPHISLLYGDHDMETREKAVREVKLPETTFIVKDFVVIPIKPNPKDWISLLTIPFGKF